MNAKPTKTGVSFSWQGAWEYDPMSGTGTARSGKDGRLRDKIRIKDGDDSTFVAAIKSAQFQRACKLHACAS